MNKVITWLMNYCMKHGIGVIYQKKLPETAPSDSWHNPKLIIFNANYYKVNERPFMMAHEIGHVVEEVPEFYKLAHLGIEKGEFSANRFAINLLALYCLDNDIYFDNYYSFARAFGIPKDKYYILEFAFESVTKV